MHYVKTEGLSEQAKAWRRHMLRHNYATIVAAMKDSPLREPVGLIIDMRDGHGRTVGVVGMRHQGLSDPEIDAFIAANSRGGTHAPTYLMVIERPAAIGLLGGFSADAAKNINAIVHNGHAAIVVVGADGNSYAGVDVATPGARLPVKEDAAASPGGV
jgi:hypothetical protein